MVKKILGGEKINGGARKGSGRKKKYSFPKSITFSLEEALKVEAKKIYGTKLNQMFNDWLYEKVNENKLK